MTTSTLKDVMTHTPLIISPQKTIMDAARLMRDYNCGAVLVGTPEHAEGILTDRDIVLRVVATGKDAERTHVKSVMTQPLHTCDIKTGLEEVAQLMHDHEVRRLGVTRDGRTNGVITLGALIAHAGSQKLSDKLLHTLLGTGKRKHIKTALATGTAGAGSESCEDEFENFEGVF